MNNIFEQTYLDILKDTRLFYESSLKFLHIDEAENKDFYGNVFKILDSQFDKVKTDEMFMEYDITEEILYEAHEEAELKKRLISRIMEMGPGFNQIRLSYLLDNISNKFKDENQIVFEKDIPIYIYKFDFSNPGNNIGFIFKSFGFRFSLDEGSLKEKFNYEARIFSEQFKKANGLAVYGGNCILLMLNLQNFSELNILHEFFHVLQMLRNKDEFEEGIEENEMRSLGLSRTDLEYIYQPKEFEAFIKVDLVNQLDEVYWKFFKDDSRPQFIDKFITQCFLNNPLKDNEIIQKITSEKLKNNDLTALRLFLSTFLIKEKSFNLKAEKWLREAFN